MAIFPAAIIAGAVFSAIAGAVIVRGENRILQGKATPGGTAGEPDKNTIRAAVQPARYIYGTARTAGSLVYLHESGRSMWAVYALGKGECDAIAGLWVDGKRQELEEIQSTERDSAGEFSAPYLGVKDGRYEDQIRIYPALEADGGTSVAAARLLRAVSGSRWTTSHAGGGVAYCVVRLDQTQRNNEGVFSGFPQLDFLVRGRRFIHPGVANFDNWGKANPNFDDTQDESAANPRLLPQPEPVFTDNAAAVIYDYLRVRRGIPFDEINVQSFKDAIPVCEFPVANSRPDDRYLEWDETSKRYALNGTIAADDDPERIRAEMEFAIRGHVFEHNTEFHISVGRNRNPSVVIWDGDIIEGSIQTAPSISARVNVANMEIEQSKYHEYQNYSSPQIRDDFQIARDGELHERDLGRRSLVNDPAALDRLIAGAFRRARSTARVTLRLVPGRFLRWMAMKPTDLCAITFGQLGLYNFLGELVSLQVNDDYSVSCVFDEILASEYDDDIGLGVIEDRRISVPRVDDPPEAIAENDITAVVRPRAGGSGSILWKVAVSVPASALPFSATILVGDLELTNSTDGNFLEFDIDIFREDMIVRVWRTNRRDLAGPVTEKAIVPQYSELIIPAMDRRSSEQLVGDLIMSVVDPNTPVVKGAEFRYTTEALDSGLSPGTITDATWSAASILDSQTLLFQPNTDPIFKLSFTANGKYRVFGRFVDSHGRYGPVSELIYINVVIPRTTAIRFGGAPAWAGTLNHLGVFAFDNDLPLVPIPDGAPNTITAEQWDGFTGSTAGPDEYKLRKRIKGAGDWDPEVSIAGSAGSYTLTGLSNGRTYEVELWRVDAGVAGPKTLVDFKPTQNAVAPDAPSVSAAARVRSIQVHSVVNEEDERAPITAHRYRIATSESALTTAQWKTAPGTADPDAIFLVSGLVASTTYHLQTQAVNSVGNGAISGIVEVRTGGDISAGSWTRSAWIYSLYQVGGAEGVPKDTLTMFGQGDDGTPLRFPPSNIGDSAWGVILYFDDGPLKEVQLVSRLQSGNTWTAFYRERTRSSASTPYNPNGADWGSWTTTIPAEYTAANLNDAISKRGYIVTPSSSENAPDLHRSDVDAQPVVMRVLFDAVTGQANAQRIRYDHFGGNSYDRTINVSNVVVAAPSRPTLTATPRTYGNSVDLSAVVAADNGAVISRWEVRFASSLAGLGTAEWVVIDDEGGNTLAHQITNLAPGTTYHFEARATNEIGTSAASDPESAQVSSVATYFGYGVGSSASPYQIDPSDFVTARAIKREFDANNRTPFTYVVSQAVSVDSVAAVIQFEGAANISGAINLADGGGRDISMRLFRGTTQIGSSETSITWTAATADSYTLLIVSAGSGVYAQSASLRVQIGAQSGDPAPAGDEGGAGILSDDPAPVFHPPRRVSLRRIGATGAGLSWREPGYADDPVAFYELEWSDGLQWRPMAKTSATEWVERAGASEDAAWRVRAVYAAGASEWTEASVADLYSDGAGIHAAGDPVEFSVVTNNASARLEWLGASVGDNATWWPFGDVEGEDQGFDAAASTYYLTAVVDLGENRSGNLDADLEVYLPDATIIRAADPAGASAQARTGSVAFAGQDIEPQVWRAGQAIAPVEVPEASSSGGEVRYAAEGLPRGVGLSGGFLRGTPQVFEGAEGVARITASAGGAEDHSYLAWSVVGGLAFTGGGGAEDDPLLVRGGAWSGDLREALLPGRTGRADPRADLMTWIRVSVPPESTWDFRLSSPDGEDFDLIHRGRFHDTAERTDIVRLVNPTGRAVTERIGIYRHGANDPSADNSAGDPVIASFAPILPAGLALAQEWDALTGAGAEVENVAGEFDYEITAFTAPARPSGQPNAPLAWTEQAVTPGTRAVVSDKRYFQWRIHIKKSRNRALKSVAFTFLELT